MGIGGLGFIFRGLDFLVKQFNRGLDFFRVPGGGGESLRELGVWALFLEVWTFSSSNLIEVWTFSRFWGAWGMPKGNLGFGLHF